MPTKRKLPEDRCSFQLTFAIQEELGKEFVAICKQEKESVPNKLRYLVREYVQWSKERTDQSTA
jgi:hypothetical protein